MEEKDIIKEIPDLYEDNGLWRGTQYSFFSHKNCEFFPCHKTDDPDNFNCLFCYCPLYALGDKCGGNFTYAYGGRQRLQQLHGAPQAGQLRLYHEPVWRYRGTDPEKRRQSRGLSRGGTAHLAADRQAGTAGRVL